MAQRRVTKIFVLYTKSAIFIQSCWRRFVAQEQKGDIVYQQAVDKQCNNIRIIASENRYWKQKLEELIKPSKLQHKQDREAQKANLEKQRCGKYEQIHALEVHYRDQLQLQQQITPRSIAGGWEEQVQINLKDTRERITKVKLDLFFNVEKKLKAVVKEIDQIQRIEDEAKRTMNHWSAWQNAEWRNLECFERYHDRAANNRTKSEVFLTYHLVPKT